MIAECPEDDGDTIIGYRDYLNILSTVLFLQKEIYGTLYRPNSNEIRRKLFSSADLSLYQRWIGAEHTSQREIRRVLCSVLAHSLNIHKDVLNRSARFYTSADNQYGAQTFSFAQIFTTSLHYIDDEKMTQDIGGRKMMHIIELM